ncbi:MAG: type phosphodiesterase/nucleotide pyrophosphatase, partial [Thermoleophilia bacterium]|nr:type phosphodiesterase/nucleotide pyrophosphatase [Thermoleophilia bacterium]
GAAIGVGAAAGGTGLARIAATHVVGPFESTAALAKGGANASVNRGAYESTPLLGAIPASFEATFRPMPSTATVYPPRDVVRAGRGPVDAGKVATLADHLVVAPGTAFVATTARDGAFEVRSREGVVRFTRWRDADGTVGYQLEDHVGSVPIERADPRALDTVAAEAAAAGGVELPVRDELQQWPDAVRRIASHFDHEDSADLLYVPRGSAVPAMAHHGAIGAGGYHGNADVTQSRAPLVMAGPGVAAGTRVDEPVRLMDIAPTIAEAIGINPVDAATGARLRGQEGRSLLGHISGGGAAADAVRAQRALTVVFDGTNAQVLREELDAGRLPNVARVAARGARFDHGALAEFPSVTWPGHATLITGAGPGRHGVLGNVYLDRERSVLHTTAAQGQSRVMNSDGLLDDRVETLFEGATRTFGPGTHTFGVGTPQARGATFAPLDGQGIVRLARHTFGTLAEIRRGAGVLDEAARAANPDYLSGSTTQHASTSTVVHHIGAGYDPKFTMLELGLTDDMGHVFGPQHDMARRALREGDRQLGRVLDAFERRGELDSTFVTVTADHGSEHQAYEGAGGWADAIRASGVPAIDADGLVYVTG